MKTNNLTSEAKLWIVLAEMLGLVAVAERSVFELIHIVFFFVLVYAMLCYAIQFNFLCPYVTVNLSFAPLAY